MKIEGEGQLLRIFVGESDHWEGWPLYEAIVMAAREHGLAGATVLRGLEGFGAHSRIHTVKVLRLSEDLPIVIEIVDRPDRIASFLPRLDRMVVEGMVTLEKVTVLKYRANQEGMEAEEESYELAEEGPPVAPPSGPPSKVASPLFEKATDRAREIIALAKREATKSHRGFVDSVDVMLAMLAEPSGEAGNLLRNLQVNAETIGRELREEVNRETPTDAYLERLHAKSLEEARWLGQNYVGTEHLLLALCLVRPSAATNLLMRVGVQPREVCREVLKIVGREGEWQRWLADHPEM